MTGASWLNETYFGRPSSGFSECWRKGEGDYANPRKHLQNAIPTTQPNTQNPGNTTYTM